jgi:hypothetical protein
LWVAIGWLPVGLGVAQGWLGVASSFFMLHSAFPWLSGFSFQVSSLFPAPAFCFCQRICVNLCLSVVALISLVLFSLFPQQPPRHHILEKLNPPQRFLFGMRKEKPVGHVGDLLVAALLHWSFLADALGRLDQGFSFNSEFHRVVSGSGFWRRLVSRRPPGVEWRTRVSVARAETMALRRGVGAQSLAQAGRVTGIVTVDYLR